MEEFAIWGSVLYLSSPLTADNSPRALVAGQLCLNAEEEVLPAPHPESRYTQLQVELPVKAAKDAHKIEQR